MEVMVVFTNDAIIDYIYNPMKRMTYRHLLLSLVAMFLFGCSQYVVSYERTPGTNFSSYRTYAWIQPDNTSGKNVNKQYLNDRVIYYSNQELSRKGMTIDVNKPDVVFTFDSYSIDKVEYQYNPPPASMSFGFGGPGYYMGYSAPLAPATITPRTYQEGTLMIYMLEASTQRVLWKGVVSKVLDHPYDIDQELKPAITKVMYTLPLKVNKP